MKQSYKSSLNRDENGKIHVAIFSMLFNQMQESLLVSSTSYNQLRGEIKPCIEPYNFKENIVVDVFETKESNEFSREAAIIGFRNRAGILGYSISEMKAN